VYRLVVLNTAKRLNAVPYAYAGGVRAGYTSHTHFVFKTQQPGQEQWLMDPWVLFWEIFNNNNRRKEGEGAAHMRTLGPAQTGQPVAITLGFGVLNATG
jgi:hypothetical protein